MNNNSNNNKKRMLSLTTNLKNTIIRRINNENSQEKKNQMIQSIKNLLKDKNTDNYIDALRKIFPKGRISNSHLNNMLDELTKLESNEDYISFTEEYIRISIEKASNYSFTQEKANNNFIFLIIAFGALLIGILGFILYKKY